MSFLQVTKVTPREKLVTGCGDCVRNGAQKEEVPIRNPVPSCRRFSTRPPSRNNSAVKASLEKAFKEFNIPIPTYNKTPKLNRKKSLSMAEINPSRTASTNKVRQFEGFHQNEAKPPRRSQDAGRRVYQQLLLNAWRRRRTQVATLTESQRRLQTQVGQFQMQIDVLQALRESESTRRGQSMTELHLTKSQLEETVKNYNVIKEEKIALAKLLVKTKSMVESGKTDVQNAENENIELRSELRASEQQLEKEREKLKKLREENKLLTERISQAEDEVATQQDTYFNLQETLINTEENLQNLKLSQEACDKEKNELLYKINKQSESNVQLEKQIQDLTSSKYYLEAKLLETKKHLINSRDSKKRLEEENQVVKRTLADLRDALQQEQGRPWWRNAGELALAPWNALQNAAYIMLPALPDRTNVATSTSDLSSTSY